MAEAMNPIPIPRSFMTDMPTATMHASLALMSRRSNALADFWRSCAEVRQPAELMAVQLNYWTQLVDDYQEALNEGLSQISTDEAAETARSATAR
jgi:hypothetical protein